VRLLFFIAFSEFASMIWPWIRNVGAYFIPVLAALLGLGSMVILNSKADSFFLLQLPHSTPLNVFFSMITWMGDGITCILAVILLALFVAPGKAFKLLFIYLAGSAVVQLFKLFLFQEAPRPAKWLELNQIAFQIPEGLDPHFWNSFPSGHSATAIAMFFFFATQTKSARLQFIFGLLAVITGYSRIYLYMHFPEDVFAGFVIGLITTLPVSKACVQLLDQNKKIWLHKPLLKWKA
jgi:membrane-associated phospholipid phosphatase